MSIENDLKVPVGQASRLSPSPNPSKSFRKRHLPHFQLSSGYYFITFSTSQRKILSASQKDSVLNAIQFWHGKKYQLLAAVIMDDHVHLIIDPFVSISSIMHSIKSFTAHEINKKENKQGKVWQAEYYDRGIRTEQEFLEKINYIANNPLKEGLAETPEEYKWLCIKGWINDSPLTGETPVLL
jgi:REP element-mobilizing transposase RayT